MRAIAITPGQRGARIVTRPEPQLDSPTEVKLRVVRVGICGTDREEISGGRADAPAGAAELVIGHEMMGQVVETGKSVARVRPGDFAVFTVRRPCGHCANCAMQRNDMCQSGDYRERGIRGLDGYQAEFVVDEEIYITRVPAELAPLGVLLEPLSIVEKAIAESLALQRRRDPEASVTPAWFSGRKCLVAGLGPVGLLAAMALALRGGEVYGLDVLDAGSVRAQWLTTLGGHYVDGRKAPVGQGKLKQSMCLVLDASGFAALEFNLLDALAPNGIYTLTGIPGGDTQLEIPGAALIRQMVLANQLMFGSVNAARGHFQMASDDLGLAQQRWGKLIATLITHRLTPQDFVASAGQRPPADAIKQVVDWDAAGKTQTS